MSHKQAKHHRSTYIEFGHGDNTITHIEHKRVKLMPKVNEDGTTSMIPVEVTMLQRFWPAGSLKSWVKRGV